MLTNTDKTNALSLLTPSIVLSGQNLACLQATVPQALVTVNLLTKIQRNNRTKSYKPVV